jgi:hypothetical protein
VTFPSVIADRAVGSCGGVRVDDDDALMTGGLRAGQSPDIRSERNTDHESVQIEAFIPT